VLWKKRYVRHRFRKQQGFRKHGSFCRRQGLPNRYKLFAFSLCLNLIEQFELFTRCETYSSLAALEGFERVEVPGRSAAEPARFGSLVEIRVPRNPMTRPRHESPLQRRARLEQFEQRLVMSAQAVACLLPELDLASPAITQQEVIYPAVQTMSNSAISPTTAAAQIADQYGFNGAGQTVAVIDSGIAWDHHALGGGFGAGHKVVGGWDFAENDANPYDDGPAGFHGTHVAGIIGSTDSQFRGVSSGVDLVALRVFDDSGNGNLKWVEQALQWVHDNRNSFANPITTVNLSLGTAWNGFNTPQWATLEEEFAQLANSGMFISVAAGNSFLSYGQQSGLSYPAVSEHVTPVASHGTNGMMSDFSQRAEHVLVAPGQSIRSTVPDHLFGGSSHNRFLGSTGTSMAAPYVAGASAILRQANEFMGTTNINQDLLYQQFRDTADKIYDSITSTYYYRVNLEAALAAVVIDTHGDTAETATDIGLLENGGEITGTIGKFTDVDHFKFEAVADGQVTLQIDTTHNLMALMEVFGSEAIVEGNQVSFDVVAGQQYGFSIASQSGNGHYTIDVSFFANEAAVIEAPPIDWGVVESGRFGGDQLGSSRAAGDVTYQLRAARDGFLTVAVPNANAAAMTLEIYDSQMNRIATSDGSQGSLRVDVSAKEGETFFVKTTGSGTIEQIEVENLVSLKNGVLTIHGTAGNDTFMIDASQGFSVSVNGRDYSFNASEVQQIKVAGGGGTDAFNLQLGSHNDVINTTAGGVTVSNSQFKINAAGMTTVVVDGGAGSNRVSMMDSQGNDHLVANSNQATMIGSGFSTTVSRFDQLNVIASAGFNTASLTGSAGSDVLNSRDSSTSLHIGRQQLNVHHFQSVTVDGGGGHDWALLQGSAGNDHFNVGVGTAIVTNANSRLVANSFETVYAFGNRGNDSIHMTDSRGNDQLTYDRNYIQLRGTGFQHMGFGFHNISVVSIGGYDTATIHDTPANDVFRSENGMTRLSNQNFNLVTSGFEQVSMIAKYGGTNTAFVNGSAGADQMTATVDSFTVSDTRQSVTVTGFERAHVDLRGGNDTVNLIGSSQKETLRAIDRRVQFETVMQNLTITNAEKISFDGNGGGDQVIFEAMGPLDLLTGLGDRATAYMKNSTITAEEFAVLEARSVNNAFAEYDLDEVDYLYSLNGNWNRKPR